MAKRLLLVDDEAAIIKGLKFSLEQDGYEILTAYDGAEALEKFRSNHVDLILLDVMLPVMDGIEVCQRIREESNVPIIMLTAKGEDMDKILGLVYGADDYMTILRRMGAPREKEESNILTVHELSVNQDLRSVTLRGQEVNLTAKEFDMLRLFITNRGKVYSREQLLEALWSNEYAGDLRTVDVHIRRLREKIEPTPSKPEYILTKWGVGYYFTDK